MNASWVVQQTVLSSSDSSVVLHQTKFNVSHLVYGYIFIYVIFQKLIDFIPAEDIQFTAATACFIDAITPSTFLLGL